MAATRVTAYTDPFCPWSWAAEPLMRRMQVEFGDAVQVTFVIVGLARELDAARGQALALGALDAAAASGQPVDARIFLRDRPASTYPAALAVAAVAEQADPAPFVRALREAVLLERRPCDSRDALLELARASMPALDAARLRVDIDSNAIVEVFGGWLERARAVPGAWQDPGTGRVAIPSIAVGDGWAGALDADACRALLGPPPGGFSPPSVSEALARGGRWTVPEIAAACDLPRPRAEAELWQLAAGWRARPEPVPGGWLWQAGV